MNDLKVILNCTIPFGWLITTSVFTSEQFVELLLDCSSDKNARDLGINYLSTMTWC